MCVGQRTTYRGRFFSYSVGPRKQTQVVNLGGIWIYPVNRLTSPLCLGFWRGSCSSCCWMTFCASAHPSITMKL